jgi:hypothetical protein
MQLSLKDEIGQGVCVPEILNMEFGEGFKKKGNLGNSPPPSPSS